MRIAIFPTLSIAIQLLFLFLEAIPMHLLRAWQSRVSRVAANQNPPLFSLRVISNREDPRDQSWSETVFKSANTDPQTYGNLPAELFDLAGLIGWLRCKFPTSTGYHVEAMTGISAATVQNWLDRRSRPSAEHFSMLLCVYGPSLFKAAVRRPAEWVDRACEAERLVEIDGEITRLAKERAALVR
ncbi:MAG: hypothetical protein E5X35_11620 [Mesorhizobium sp.]|uniref:hypothetical protein n=1 Tax=unclassified Mesorhizobium TaxID=325217 RepID=UPI000FCB213A|nr:MULTISPECIES: hypothetical protein [unclassified Mesorhizobium]RUV65203.1 hypothetical protein EOA85_00120 [Mesorhizobium sp. M5C.F.Ca.IN.020.29.1.1]TIM87643.1 MAG: hypothetical protein E5Y50_11445 [Mesorhizobium sp.]TIR33306.1 MAG: hypothetical protein E5X35_11620 [Mesorhizobium sp.]